MIENGVLGIWIEHDGEDYIMMNFMISAFQYIIIRMIKSRRTIWSGHVAGKQMREMRTKFWSENLEEEITFETLALMEDNIKVWVLNKHDVTVWTELMRLRIGNKVAAVMNTAIDATSGFNKRRRFC
jgi:hypothetical protein